MSVSTHTRYGIVNLPDLPDSADTQCRSLIEYGEWAQFDVDLLLRLVNEGSVVIDAAAFVGAYTLPFARRVVPAGAVYAFEPSLIYTDLKETIAQNALSAVTVYNAALDAQVGPQRLAQEALDSSQVAVPHSEQDRPAGDAQVAHIPSVQNTARVSLTLDTLGLDRCSLIHLACSGAEWRALVGGIDLIRRERPYVSVECTDVGAAWTAASIMIALGYTCWLHSWPGFNSDNFRHSRSNLFGGLRQHSLLCVPREREDTAILMTASLGEFSAVEHLHDLVVAYGSRMAASVPG